MKKNILYALAIGASLSCAPLQALNLDIDWDGLKNRVMKLEPVVDQIANYVEKGKFDDLRQYLKQNIGTLNLAFLLDDLANHLGDIQSALQMVVSNASRVPVDSQTIKAATTKIKQLINDGTIMNAKQYIMMAKPYAVIDANKIDAFVDGLKMARSQAINAYNKMAGDLRAYYNDTLLPLANQVRGIPAVNMTMVQTALKMIIDTINGKTVDLTDPRIMDVIGAVDQLATALPKMIPLLPMFVEGTTKLALQANKAFNLVGQYNAAVKMIPREVMDQINQLGDIAQAVKADSMNLGNQLNSVLNQVTGN
jgi:hypothetical protein